MHVSWCVTLCICLLKKDCFHSVESGIWIIGVHMLHWIRKWTFVCYRTSWDRTSVHLHALNELVGMRRLYHRHIGLLYAALSYYSVLSTRAFRNTQLKDADVMFVSTLNSIKSKDSTNDAYSKLNPSLLY